MEDPNPNPYNELSRRTYLSQSFPTSIHHAVIPVAQNHGSCIHIIGAGFPNSVTKMEHINWIVASGAVGLGFVLGALAGFYVVEAQDDISHRIRHSADAAITGAVFVGMIHAFRGYGLTEITEEYGGYVVGLALGLAFGLLLNRPTFRKAKQQVAQRNYLSR